MSSELVKQLPQQVLSRQYQRYLIIKYYRYFSPSTWTTDKWARAFAEIVVAVDEKDKMDVFGLDDGTNPELIYSTYREYA